MDKIKENKNLTLILLVFSCVSFLFSWFTPIFEYPDEEGHFSIVRFIAENNSLPVQTTQSWLHEGHNPPLYYSFLAIGYKIIGSDVLNIELEQNPAWGKNNHKVFLHGGQISLLSRICFQILRSFNLLLALMVLWFVYKISLEIFNDNKKALLPVVLVAFLPQFTWLSGSLNPDILLTFFSSVVVFLLLKIKKDNKKMDYLWLGLSLGLGLLTKYPMIIFLPIAMAICFYMDRSKYKKNFFLFFLVVCFISGWFYLRNFILYGELIPFSLYKKLYFSLNARNDFLSLSFWVYFLISLMTTFFAEFDHGYFFLPAWMYAIYFMMVLTIIFALFKTKREKCALLFEVTFFSNLALVISFAINFSTIIQGRFLFPSLAILSIIAAKGLLWLFQKNRYAMGFFLTLYLLLNLYSLFFVLIPGYA